MRFKLKMRAFVSVKVLLVIATVLLSCSVAISQAYGGSDGKVSNQDTLSSSSPEPDTKKISNSFSQQQTGAQQQHFEPKVAIFCPPTPASQSQKPRDDYTADDDIFSSSQSSNQATPRRRSKPNYPQYITQYLTKSGEWLPDLSRKSTCTHDKLEILRHCQRLYPDKDITNIVESNKQVKVTNLCKISGTSGGGQGKVKCVGREENRNGGVWVTPYRCLESPFQSDALLVPSPCIFDHIHNASTCLETKAWNITAKKSCDARSMELKSYAILLPCGVGLFAGVEFVCCPVDKSVHATVGKNTFSHDLGVFNARDDLDDDDDEEDDEDQDEDDYDEDDYDDDYLDTDKKFGEVTTSTTSTTTTTTTTTTQKPQIDPYFRKFDTYNEHSNYKSALHRLESVHRSRMQKVTQDWNEMEAKYQEMRNQGMNKEAEEFKHTITLRFQKTIKSLEEEGQAEKRQLIAVHQQRVLAHINERKKESMECYTQALNERPQNVNKIRKCVEKLMRVLHKDRHHTLAHYKHLLKSGGGGGVEEEYTLQRLVGISATARSCLQMLNRYGNLADELKPLIEDYVLSLQGRDDPPGSLLTATRDTEQLLLQKYRSQVIRKYPSSSHDDDDLDDDSTSAPLINAFVSSSTTEGPSTPSTTGSSFGQFTGGSSTGSSSSTTERTTPPVDDSGVDDYVGGEKEDKVEEGWVAHALVHEGVMKGSGGKEVRGNNVFDQTYTVRREVYHYRENKSVYFTMAFAGIAIVGAMVIGLVVLRRRANSPRNQGFLEVNTNMGFTNGGSSAITPEEKHVANMQINGYENPTYKYFETANT